MSHQGLLAAGRLKDLDGIVIPGGFGDERIVAAYQSVVDACKKHGKHAGVGGIADQALIKRYVDMGVRLVLPGSDLGFLQSAASATAATMRGFL